MWLLIFATLHGAQATSAEVISLFSKLEVLGQKWRAGEQFLTTVNKLVSAARGPRAPINPGIRRRLEMAAPTLTLAELSYDRRHVHDAVIPKSVASWNFTADYLILLGGPGHRQPTVPFFTVSEGKASVIDKNNEYRSFPFQGELFGADSFGKRITAAAIRGFTVESADFIHTKSGLNLTNSVVTMREQNAPVTALAVLGSTVMIGDNAGYLQTLVKSNKAKDEKMVMESGPTWSEKVKVADTPILQIVKSMNGKEALVLTDTMLGIFNLEKNDFGARPCRIPPSRAISFDGKDEVYVTTNASTILRLSTSELMSKGNCVARPPFPVVDHFHDAHYFAVQGAEKIMVASTSKGVIVYRGLSPVARIDIPPVRASYVFGKSLILITADPVSKYAIILPPRKSTGAFGRFNDFTEPSSSLESLLGMMEQVSRPVALGVIFVIVLLYNIRKAKKKRE